MKKRFVIAVEGLTSEQTEKISEFFKSEHGWWHWIEGFWLVTDPSKKLTAKKIRDVIHDIAPQSNQVVLEIRGTTTWAGFGPSTEENDMFKWLKKTWPQ